MKRIIIVALSAVLLFTAGFHSAGLEFDLSRGAVQLNYKQHNPITVQIEDGEDGSAQIGLDTDYYTSNMDLEASGKFDLSTVSLAQALINQVSVKTSDGEEIVLNSTLKSDSQQDSVKGEPDKIVEVAIETTKTESGILKVNYNNNEPELNSSSNVHSVSNRLGVDAGVARDLIDQFGQVTVSNAIDYLDGRRTRRGSPVAGGAGSVSGQDGVVGVDQLSAREFFSLYIKGVKYNGYVRYNSVFLEIYHSTNGKGLNHIPVRITLVGPVKEKSTGSPDIVLLDSLKYSADTGYHRSFKDAAWLVEPEHLPAGPYELHLDVDRINHIKIPVKLTEDNRILMRE